MDPARLPDPFAIQADPSLYVPRRATEEALDELERGLAASPHGAVCFTGPPGIGKSLLLRVLAVELSERYRTAYLPYARLPAGGLWMCVATELGLEAGRDPKRAVRRLLGDLAASRQSLLLEVDDASSLPGETLYDLLAFARSEPGLRVLLTYSESDELPGPLPEDLPVVRLEAPMTRAETQDYVKGRLARSGAPRGLGDRFDSATIARLHRESAGNPLRLHGLAVAIARGAGPAGPVPLPRPALVRSEPVPTPAEPAAAEAEPEPAAPAPAAPRRRRRGRGALAGPLWAMSGLCVGLALSVLLAEWRRREGTPAELPAQVERAPAPSVDPGEIPVLPPPAALGAPSIAADLPPVATPPPSLRPSVSPAPAEAPAPADSLAPAPDPEVPPVAAAPGAGEAASPRAAAAAPPAVPPPGPPTGPEAAAPAPPSAPSPDAAAAPPPPSEVPPVAAPPPAAPAPRREPAPLADGRLDIHSDTPVLIEIDGRQFGAAPVFGVRLARGEHRVIAHYADGGAGLKTIYLGDEDVSVTFR